MRAVKSSILLLAAAVVAVAGTSSVAGPAPSPRRAQADYVGVSTDVGVVSSVPSIAGHDVGGVVLATRSTERTVVVSATDDVVGPVAVDIWQRSTGGSIQDLGTFCGTTPIVKLARPGTPIEVRIVASLKCGVSSRPPTRGTVTASFRR
jgi:hypothetical protein